MEVDNNIWILIAGDDARLWNLIVRAVPGLHTAKLAEEMKAKFKYVPDTNDHYGTICGLVHTGLGSHQQYGGGQTVEIAMNYGLLSNAPDQYAANINTLYRRIRVYSVGGVPTRSNGPAIMVMCRKTFAAMDIYIQAGVVEKIDLFMFPNTFDGTLISVTPGNSAENVTVTYYDDRHIKDMGEKYPQYCIREILENSKTVGGFSKYNDNVAHSIPEINEYIAEAIERVMDDSIGFSTLITVVTNLLQ